MARKHTTKAENPYKAIFENPKHRIMFILWSMSSGLLLFGYFGVSNWLPSYLETELGIKFKEMALYMAGTYLTMMFAKVIAGFMADKIGRKIVFAFGTMGTALFIPFLVYMHTPENIGWLMITFGFIRYSLCHQCYLSDRELPDSYSRDSYWRCL